MPTYKATLFTTTYVQVGEAFKQIDLQVKNDVVQLMYADNQPSSNADGFFNLDPIKDPYYYRAYPDQPLWAKANNADASLFVTVSDDPRRQVQQDSNNTTTSLPTTSTPYTGTWTRNDSYDSILVNQGSNTTGTGYIDFFNQNGTTPAANATPTFSLSWNYATPSVNEFHKFEKGSRWYRLRYVPDTNPSSFYMDATLIRQHSPLQEPLNATTQQDSDSLLVKSVDTLPLISLNKMTGSKILNIYGKNPDIDTGSIPEDVWNGGGVYTGFPTASPQQVTVTSSSGSDTGTVTITGLKTSTSTDYESETVTVGGTSASSWFRIHAAKYDSNDDTTFNVGEITIAHVTTTSNVFIKIPVGESFATEGAITIPWGWTGLLQRVHGTITKSAEGRYATGALWVRERTLSPTLQRPFTLTSGAFTQNDILGGLLLPQGTDIIPRITEVSTNDTSVIFGFDLLLTRN